MAVAPSAPGGRQGRLRHERHSSDCVLMSWRMSLREYQNGHGQLASSVKQGGERMASRLVELVAAACQPCASSIRAALCSSYMATGETVNCARCNGLPWERHVAMRVVRMSRRASCLMAWRSMASSIKHHLPYLLPKKVVVINKRNKGSDVVMLDTTSPPYPRDKGGTMRSIALCLAILAIGAGCSPVAVDHGRGVSPVATPHVADSHAMERASRWCACMVRLNPDVCGPSPLEHGAGIWRGICQQPLEGYGAGSRGKSP